MLAAIRQIAPEVASDQQIDVDRLKTLLGQECIAPVNEHYELSWAGKAAARREIQKTTSATLLPAPGNPARAPHMLIEGENLEVLRVLQKSYYGKVKMIYIDPPYNTGNDSFVYPDDYTETLEGYQRRTGERDASGFLNKQSLWKKNSKENGHYHSAWLSMMYPRLYLARNLLRDDGVIFISIDENEIANLIFLMDEIFGEENNLNTLIWHLPRGINAGQITRAHEYVIAFAKNKNNLRRFERSEAVHSIERCNKKVDRRHPASRIRFKAGIRYDGEDQVLSGKLSGTEGVEIIGNMILKDGKLAEDVEVLAGWTMKTMIERWMNGEDVFDTKGQLIEEFFFKSNGKLYSKKILTNEAPKSVILDLPDTQAARESLAQLMGSDIFDYPKPFELIKRFAKLSTSDSDVCLDFFSGSGTTMQAVMELNLEDGGNRQCICVQIPEKLEENTEAYKAGYRSIADITRARIDKAIAKLKAEQPEKTQNLACAQFTLVPSHFKQWRSDVEADALRAQLEIFQQSENAVPQSTDAQTAMLAELLLKMGLGALGVQAISNAKVVAGVTVHRVSLEGDRELWLCFEPYQDALKDEIARAQPAQVIMLNSCFAGDKADEQLANLQLELQGLDIGLTVI